MAKKQAGNLRTLRFVLWGLVIVAGIAATALYVIQPPERPVGLYGGEFELASTRGGTFTEEDLRGTPSLVFFGYTFCPDVCPTTIADTTAWRQRLGLSADELRLIFVTVDPERDTLASMRTYLESFGSPVIGLRGTEEQTAGAKDAFGVFSEKVEDEASTDYLVNHTASVFLIGADGRFEGTIAYGESSDTAIEKIRKLVEA